MVKLNGYTFGERTVPFAVMATLDLTRTRLNHDASGNIVSPKDGLPIFDAASIFLAGKITDRQRKLFSRNATQGWTPEIFWIPVQNIRLGLQYIHFTKYLGARSNYDGHGRNATDNDTLFLYLWSNSDDCPDSTFARPGEERHSDGMRVRNGCATPLAG
jgi:hypothetical protein